MKGASAVAAMIPCTFSQRLVSVTMSRNDGVIHELEPAGSASDNLYPATMADGSIMNFRPAGETGTLPGQ